MQGVGLLLAHPEIPTCADCKQWIYSEEWRREERAGVPVKRPRGSGTPCWRCPKSEDRKTPNPDAELTARNSLAFKVYLQIKAGLVPERVDTILRENCGLIRWVDDGVQRGQQNIGPLLLSLIQAKGK